MEILVTLVLSIIHIIWNILQGILILGAVGLVLAAVGMGFIFYKGRGLNRVTTPEKGIVEQQKKYRNTKERAAHGSYFEEFSEPAANGKKLCHAGVNPAVESDHYWREIDRLNDDSILDVSEGYR